MCVQNNPYCQKAALEMNILPILSSLLDTDYSVEVRIKALFAISGMHCVFQGMHILDDDTVTQYYTIQAPSSIILLASI